MILPYLEQRNVIQTIQGVVNAVIIVSIHLKKNSMDKKLPSQVDDEVSIRLFPVNIVARIPCASFRRRLSIDEKSHRIYENSLPLH
jgi:hypothetical protein